ncbi:universal stress protein UspA [Kurthia sp. 3B1D]|uniref:Universal stress protein UspA n=2 Tax=Kurthia TaxID=1649 RepID=A0A433RRA2_9BACL|nr:MULTISPECIES: universal stress protein [unclassified Kurthia]RUS53236.1 universal stress protein UspA [Kurthia sp. 3B1D]HIX42998.1 universal stress protein [Candidatus Kurthia intestinigallinarum]
MFEKILVAIDESDLNAKILEAAAELASLNNGIVTIVNVHQNPIAPAYPYDVTRDYVKTVNEGLLKDSEERLEKAKEIVLSKHPECVIELVSLAGNPADKMLEYAEETKQSVIVIGSRGLRGLKGMLLGSVSSKIAQLSPCQVLIVH